MLTGLLGMLLLRRAPRFAALTDDLSHAVDEALAERARTSEPEDPPRDS
jgi:hypothetical protein